MTYYDGERYIEIPTERVVHSHAGYTREVSYGVCWRLPDGRYLTAIRHQDRGDLATDLRIHCRMPRMRGVTYVGGTELSDAERDKLRQSAADAERAARIRSRLANCPWVKA